MNSVRADILPTTHPYKRAVQIVIDAPAHIIFDLLADPRRHCDFDGSGTVKSSVSGPSRLFLGARFGMGMNIKVNYRVVNTVHEFVENELIAWSHFSGHRWRYELEPLEGGRTKVTETFDGTFARLPIVLKFGNVLDANAKAMAKTLVRLKEMVEN